MSLPTFDTYKAVKYLTKADLESLEQRLTIRLGGLIVVGVAVLATLDKLL